MSRVQDIKQFHKDFLPKVLGDSDNIYVELLEKHIANKDVSNIALTGGYGSGKSSIFETYISRHKERKCCKVSLAKYNNQYITNEKVFKENIYDEIIKQIYLSIPEQRVPRSKFSYLYKKFDYFGTIAITIIIAPLFLMFINRFVGAEINICIQLLNRFKMLYLALCLIAIIVIIVIIALNKPLIATIKFNNFIMDFSLHNKKSNPLDRHLSEIIYLFKNSEIEAVFFEDLDRFNDVNIFVELKELNKCVNLALKDSDKHVTFIYAIKEDLFVSSYDRFKFNDVCISVLPYSSVYNTYDLLLENFQEVIDYYSLNIRRELFNTISLYIREYRVVIAIVNDFVIYYNRLLNLTKKIKIYPEQLLYMIAYKNLFLIDFARLYEKKSLIDMLLKRSKDNSSIMCDTLNGIY